MSEICCRRSEGGIMIGLRDNVHAAEVNSLAEFSLCHFIGMHDNSFTNANRTKTTTLATFRCAVS